jgi:hypothetical protein
MIAGAVFAKYQLPGRTMLFVLILVMLILAMLILAMLILATAIVPFEAYMIPLILSYCAFTGSTHARQSSYLLWS